MARSITMSKQTRPVAPEDASSSTTQRSKAQRTRAGSRERRALRAQVRRIMAGQPASPAVRPVFEQYWSHRDRNKAMPECSRILDLSNRSASRRQSKKANTSRNPGEIEKPESAGGQTLAYQTMVYVPDPTLALKRLRLSKLRFP